MLIGQVIDSALVPARPHAAEILIHSAFTLTHISAEALKDTLEMFSHCLKSPYQSTLLCPATWLLNLYRSNMDRAHEHKRLMSPQFLHNKVSLWLHSKFLPDIAQETELFFGFDTT